MKYLRFSDTHLQRMDRRVQVVLGLTFLLLAGLAIYSAWRRDVFTPGTRFSFHADNSNAIARGQFVQISGFKVGEVTSVSLQDDRRVKVEIVVYNPYLKFVKKDSVAMLRATGFIGQNVIDLLPGSASTPAAKEDDELLFRSEKSIAELSQELKDQITPINQEVLKLLQSFNDPEGDFRKNLRNVQETTRTLQEALPGLLAKVNTTLANVEQVSSMMPKVVQDSSAEANKLFAYFNDPQADFRRILSNVQGITHTLNSEVPGILTRVDSSLAHVESMTGTLRKAVNEAAPRIPLLVEEGADAARGANEVVHAVKKLWPISGNLPAEPPAGVVPQPSPDHAP